MSEITHYTNETEFPRGLISADEAAEKCNVQAARLVNLAIEGVAPHWMVDGNGPFFQLSEIKKWVGSNLITRCNGDQVNVNLRIAKIGESANKDFVPDEIQDMPGLKQIPIGEYLPSVYFLCKEGNIVYIGQSVNPSMRVAQHSESKEFDAVYAIHVPRDSLNRVEGALIRHLQPPLNGRNSNKALRAPMEDGPGVDDETLAELGV